MNRTVYGSLFGLCVAIFVATRFEGERTIAVGVVAGYLLGAAVALLGAAWQRHVLRIDLRRGMQASLVTFVMKIVVALMAGAALRFVDAVGRLADWRAFLVAYVVAAVGILLLSSLDLSRAVKESTL